MTRPQSLHRFAGKMSILFHSAVQRIANQYGGDASRIWLGKSPRATLVYRFLEFDGVGPQIATIAANFLVRQFKILHGDPHSIDISADTHVRRVFGRLALCPPDASVEQVVYRARALYPEFPSIMDAPCWHIGKEFCLINRPKCDACHMNDVCPHAEVSTR